jgi:catechol 2,3-dioxygenase-like lactoylglutathione lyase family enzyme
MPNLDNLNKRAKSLVKQHRERYQPVAEKLRDALPRFAGRTDRDILDASFTLTDAHQIVAREAGYESWAEAARALKHGSGAPDRAEDRPPSPRVCIAYPQLFVADVTRSAEFYKQKLGFAVEYLYGEPPFYALVARDGVGLNLRHVDAPPIDPALARRESLLGAAIVVDGVKELYLEFKERGVEFEQALKLQPWGATDFIVRDPDGNLISFASPASDSDRSWSAGARRRG